jgi:hypothetical protein
VNNNALALRIAALGSVLFGTRGKVAGALSGPARAGVRVGRLLGLRPATRRVPIRVWQTHSWTKKIVQAPGSGDATKARTAR